MFKPDFYRHLSPQARGENQALIDTRNSLLRTLDLKKLHAAIGGDASPEVLTAAWHLARANCEDLTDAERFLSIDWLKKNQTELQRMGLGSDVTEIIGRQS